MDGTRSERKLDIRASIPEVDDQFALAESRCDDLQEKIDLVKVLKRKRKLKKRSMTRVNDPAPAAENVPFITVRTQPKKKVSQQANTRVRRLEVPHNPTRGYLDPATVEQHRMLGQVRTYGHNYKQPRPELKKEFTPLLKPYKSRSGRTRADGDGMCGQGVQISCGSPLEVACGQDEVTGEYSDTETYDQRHDDCLMASLNKPTERYQLKTPVNRRRPRGIPKETPKWTDDSTGQHSEFRAISSPVYRRRQAINRQQQQNLVENQAEERPVVELFNKSRSSPSPDSKRQTPIPTADPYKQTRKVAREQQHFDDATTGPLENITPAESKKEVHRLPRRVKYRSRRYELPTVASQMKQAGMRHYYGNVNHTNIPFVVSKSTAPSHNIGVNIQQVLNGLKIQQPLSGIPLTIAHHMGLGHIPTYGTKSATAQNMSLDNREINVIKLGARLLRLPSYKYMSYSRLLTLYREGDGMVPRFLRAISRPHYFYTSMYNLATNREDFDGATSKGRGGSQEAKQSLAEYASLYREYEQVDKCLKEGNCEPELERRREELSSQLAAREEHIRKVVQEFRAPGEGEPNLRASASTAEEGYRHSTYKLNVGD